MNRRAVRLALMAAGAVVLFGCDGIFGPDIWDKRRDALEEGRRLWAEAGIDAYRYRLYRGCFCELEGELIVTVQNGVVVAAETAAGDSVAADQLHIPETVDDLFTLAEQGIDSEAFRFAAQYHPELGYPTVLDFDPEPESVGEELHLEAGDLVPLNGG